MFFNENENTGGVFKSIRGCDEPIIDGGNQTYSKSEQNKIVKSVKSKIKRLKKQQKELEHLKNQQRHDEKKLNQLRYSQTENMISQRELQKFLKRVSK